MAIDANFPTISFEGANPRLFGQEMSNKLLQQAIANQIAGVQSQYARPMTQNDLLAKQLQNQIAEVTAKYAEPNAQEALKKAQQYNQYYGLGEQADIGLKRAQAEHYKSLENQRTNPAINDFMKLPKASQKSYIDQIIAMGYSYPEAIQHAYAGTDFGDLAQQKGYSRDLTDVPKAASELTGATKTQLARANMAKAGLDAADETINQGIAHYSGQPTIKDVPLGFYKDAISGQNKDKQSDFIASTVLAQDQAFLRARQAGAPLSQGLLRHTLETSLTDVKGRYAFVKPDVFKEAGKKIKKAFDDINAAENKAAYTRQFLSGTAKNSTSQSRKNPGEMSTEEIERELGGMQ